MEVLLPAIWDDKYLVDGFRNDDAPDPDMPRGSVDHSKSGGHVVAIADVRRAWAKADLTRGQRQALLLRYGMDEPAAETAALLGIAKSSVTERCFNGVGVIVAFLNGKDFNEQDENEEAA